MEEVTFMGEMTEIRVRVPEENGSRRKHPVPENGRPRAMSGKITGRYEGRTGRGSGREPCCSGMIWNEGYGAGNGMWWRVLCCGGDCAQAGTVSRRGLCRENMDGRRCR
ncbi:MAG: hypothetical protein ACLTBV_17075 [Enterocloster bolteae]